MAHGLRGGSAGSSPCDTPEPPGAVLCSAIVRPFFAFGCSALDLIGVFIFVFEWLVQRMIDLALLSIGVIQSVQNWLMVLFWAAVKPSPTKKSASNTIEMRTRQ